MSIDYTSYTDEPVVDTIVEETKEDVIEDVIEDYPTMMGIICNAKKVYLRQDPNKNSSHISVLDEGDEVMIDDTEDDEFGNGWYHLITACGNEGYTMSDYVKIVE